MPRFTHLNAAGTAVEKGHPDAIAALDTKTGLTWLLTPIMADTHADAIRIAAEQTIGGDACRLPEVDELLTLVDYKRVRPATFEEFGDLPTDDWYWTNTPFAGVSGYAWLVGFGYGDSSWSYRGSGGYALAVRGAPRQ